MYPNILTLREVAALLKVHPSTIYRLLKQGLIPGFKVGSDHRFLLSEIDKWSKQTAQTAVRGK